MWSKEVVPSPLGQAAIRRELKKRYAPVVAELQHAFADRLKTVVLFGSQARGEAQFDSDHDLFIVVKDLPSDPLARHRLVRSTLRTILDRLPGSISFVARTPEEFGAALTPLSLDVCVDGICLFGADYFEPYRRKALNALQSSGLRREKAGDGNIWLFSQRPVGNWELSWEGFREGV